ncbi:hypothetical protein TSUD_336030 [Trifolium subterraneum]|uniref:Uncharacterized protein n=1 Tax=Trifolium subterraneum TaxID=3900 RepID=A0A2Z6MM59_TRISU|nr:hypothetical protein TSUD_336030 [Trifolium subterraneum]
MDPPSKRYSGRQRCLALETIPSFSLSKQTGLREEEEDVEESDIEDEGYDEFSVMNRMMVSSEEDRVCRVSFDEEGEFGGKEMYLAKGLGVDFCGGGDGIGGGCRGGGNGGSDYNSMGSERNDGDNNNHGVEEYYKKMCKQDLEGAEEYYSRAILADPNDGEVLSQYGKLIWELYHDQERASSYFEQAVQASPDDSHVQAAYASFLWDTEEDESCNESQCLPQHFHLGAMATTGA